MRYRKLTPSGDMSFGHQQRDFYRDEPNAVAQAIQTRLRLWLGEWFIDQTDGTPYVQAVLGKHTQDGAAYALRARILETPGVTGLTEFELRVSTDQRTAFVDAHVQTAYGPVAVVETF